MKEKDLNTLWTVPVYLPGINPIPTYETIQKAESKIGFKLPKEYLDILQIQNGGDIRYGLKNTPHNQILGIGDFQKSITNYEWFKEYEEGLNFKLDGLFPFDGDGHWNICLDYRKNTSEPEVTYIDTEIEFEKPIAQTFKEYLALLEIETNDRYVIETEFTIEEIINKISTALNSEFVVQENLAKGYKIYRTNYKDGSIWISPNKVPSSYMSEKHELYPELKNIKVTEELRYPELPKDYLLIEISEQKERQNIFTYLKKIEIVVRELSAYFEKSPNR